MLAWDCKPASTPALVGRSITTFPSTFTLLVNLILLAVGASEFWFGWCLHALLCTSPLYTYMTMLQFGFSRNMLFAWPNLQVSDIYVNSECCRSISRTSVCVTTTWRGTRGALLGPLNYIVTAFYTSSCSTQIPARV